MFCIFVNLCKIIQEIDFLDEVGYNDFFTQWFKTYLFIEMFNAFYCLSLSLCVEKKIKSVFRENWIIYKNIKHSLLQHIQQCTKVFFYFNLPSISYKQLLSCGVLYDEIKTKRNLLSFMFIKPFLNKHKCMLTYIILCCIFQVYEHNETSFHNTAFWCVMLRKFLIKIVLYEKISTTFLQKLHQTRTFYSLIPLLL